MAITGNFNPSTNTLSLDGDALDNTITAGRSAAGAILVNDGAVPVQGGTATIANTSLLVIDGHDGNDTIALDEKNGALTAANITGGAGNDAITGGSGADLITGDDGNDTLLGKGGADVLAGGAGNDLLIGGTGNDSMLGGDGDDRIVWNPGDGNDTIDGGNGFDTLAFNGANLAEKITLSNDDGFARLQRDVAGIDMSMSDVERIELKMLSGVDTVTVNDLTGTGVGEVAIDLDGSEQKGAGDGAADTVFMNGNDEANTFVIAGNGSEVAVNGLSTKVTIDHAEVALDRLTINTFGGNDVIDASGLAAGVISLTVNAGSGNDFVIGSGGADLLIGGDGDDVISGGGGDDVAVLGAGNDAYLWRVGDGNDTVDGQDGSNRLVVTGAAVGDHFILTANGPRALLREDVSQSKLDVDGFGQIDLTASSKFDIVKIGDLAGTGVTKVNVDLGIGSGTGDGAIDQVFVTGSAGGDAVEIVFAAGAVFVDDGPSTTIKVTGSDAFDQLFMLGGAGDDSIDARGLAPGYIALTVEGGAGADHMFGSGIDTLSYSGSSAGVTIDFAKGAALNGDAAGDQFSGFENLIGSAHSDSLGGDDGANTITAGAGNDNVKGGGGADTLIGGTGDDVIDGGAGDDTVVINADFHSAKIAFEGDGAVLITTADGADVVRNVEHFQFTDGRIDQLDGNPLVNDLFYFANNRDVWDAGLDAETHYNSVGWLEGRDPSADFSTRGYLAANPDVKAAGINPLLHFDQIGWKEGRDPSADFDVRLYLEHNPDVAASGMNPLAHYEQFGRAEGREIFAAIGDVIKNGFDFEYYLLKNPDVAAAGIDPLFHFETVGWKEGRDPNAWFDTDEYLSAYRDVAAAGINPLDHYMAVGAHEGRDPSGAFDTLHYLAANPDVAAAGINPLQHFLLSGIHEGRSSFSDGVFH